MPHKVVLQFSRVSLFALAIGIAGTLIVFICACHSPSAGGVPAYSAQPADQIVQYGSDAVFTACIEDSPNLPCQWQRNEIDIPGATSPTFVLRRVVLEDSGATFRCVAANQGGSAISRSAVLTVVPLGSASRTYYVDYAVGLDTQDGSVDRPWKHAPGDPNASGNAASAILGPGDTVAFRGGVEYRGCVKVRASGSPGLPVSFSGMGWGPGKAIFLPPENPDPALHQVDGFEIFGDHVCVAGFSFKDFPEYAVEVRQGSSATDASVIDCEVGGCGSGAMLGGTDCLVRNCSFSDMRMIVNDSVSDNDYGAIGIWVAGREAQVLDNLMRRCKAPSQDYGFDGGAIELYGGVDGGVIMRNRAFDCNGFIEAGSGGGSIARGVTVAYNLSVGNGPFCIIHGEGPFAVTPVDFRIDNNTVVDDGIAAPPASWSNWAIFVFAGIEDPDAIRVRNNIFWVRDSQWICPAEAEGYAFTHESNIYRLMNSASRLGFALTSGEVMTDPAFRDQAGGDFELSPGSPARNSGIALGYAEDILRRPLPSGGRPSIGAFQTP